MSNAIVKKQSNRLLFLDLLKFLSISYIFIYHFICDFDQIHHMIDLSFINSFCLKPNFNMGIIANVLFIIISGASLGMSQDKKKDLKPSVKSIFTFYKKRAIRILIPYYIVYVTFYIYIALYNHVLKIFTYLRPIDYLWNVFAMDGYASVWGFSSAYLNVGEWFLGCIVICYLFFPLLYYLNKKFKYITFVLMTVFVVYQLTINKYTPNFHLNAYYQIYNFYLGIFLSDFDLIKKIDFKYHIIFIIAIVFCYNANFLLPYMLLAQSFISLFIYIIFYHIERFIKAKQITTFLTKFSIISYEFFLVHHFVISQQNFILNKETVTATETIHYFFTDILWVIALSIIFHRIIEFVISFITRNKKTA